MPSSRSNWGHEVEKWKADGFLRIEGLLPQETVSQLPSWVEETAAWPNVENGWLHHWEQTARGIVLARTENILPYHRELKRLLTEGPIVDLLTALMGEPPFVYKEKVNYKYPGGAGYAAHQDAPAYEYVHQHVTCLVAIDPATTDNGCLWFAAGEHNRGLLEMDERKCIAKAEADKLSWQPCELKPGDVVFFSSYAPHYSAPNESSSARRALYVTYNPQSVGNFRERYYADRQATLESKPSNWLSNIGHFQGTLVNE